MNSLLVFSVVLWIHIFFGAITLFVAPAAMLTRKGGLWHRRWGKMYFWSITIVAVTAVVMLLIRSGLFFSWSLSLASTWRSAATGSCLAKRRNNAPATQTGQRLLPCSLAAWS
jgi:uncharacterized membrane protein